MKRSLPFIAGLLLVARSLFAVPVYDHVVVVIFENHSYEEILVAGLANAPYINGTLRPQSANITGAFGIQHPSQPNYYWLFSGSNQGIVEDTHPTGPFISAPNLYTALTTAGLTFSGYLDHYKTGDDLYKDTDNYAVRHVPWLGFINVPDSVSIPFDDFPTTAEGFAALPHVTFVIPGLDHDMHDYDSMGNAVSNPMNSLIAISNGDAWLQANLDAYVQWAKVNNSLLIFTFDENSTADWITPPLGATNAYAFTSPILGPNPAGPSGPNRITMLFAGAGVAPGYYSEGPGVTNVNILRTIEFIYNLPRSGAQSPLAALAGIGDSAILDIFAPAQPAVAVNGGRRKQTGNRNFKLRGTASVAGGQLSAVQVKVRNHPYVNATGIGSWQRGIRLARGRNTVRIRSVDRTGVSSRVIKITINRR